MLLLDTNVLSALMRPESNEPVALWLDRQDHDVIWTSAISIYEIRAGILLLPEGRRKARLSDEFDDLLRDLFPQRIASYDPAAAECAADIGVRHRRMGLNVEVQDIMIAGIAVARNAKLATRNVKDFEGLGLRLVNPWD